MAKCANSALGDEEAILLRHWDGADSQREACTDECSLACWLDEHCNADKAYRDRV